jgi:hypothetical protein
VSWFSFFPWWVSWFFLVFSFLWWVSWFFGGCPGFFFWWVSWFFWWVSWFFSTAWLIDLIWYLLVAWVFSNPRWLRPLQQNAVWFERAFGVVLLALAARLLIETLA